MHGRVHGPRGRGRHAGWLLALLGWGVICAPACKQAPPDRPPPSRTGTSSAKEASPAIGLLALPAHIDGFTAGPLVKDATAERRSYRRGEVQIAVTMARLPMSEQGYEQWVKASTAGFPQATGVVPPAIGNGFYQCAESTPPTCALLIQLRAGIHLEIRGEGSASRADLDAVAQGLPLH